MLPPSDFGPRIGPDPYPAPPTTSTGPAAAPGSRDVVDLGGDVKRDRVPRLPSGTSPREGERRGPGATTSLVAQSLAAGAAAAALFGPAMSATAVLPLFGMEPSGKPRGQGLGKWDRETGWRIPRNTSGTPVAPRYAYEVPVGTEDLGPVHVASTMDGHIRGLRLQWPDEVEEPALSAQKTTFRDLLTRLDVDVLFHIVAEGMSAGRLQSLMGEWHVSRPERVHIHPMHLHSSVERLYHPMSMWARDSAILMRTEDKRELLLLPRSFRGDGEVDADLNRLIVHGSGEAPAALQRAGLMVRRSTLNFEGGDIIPSQSAVLLGGRVVAQNMAEMRLSRGGILSRFALEMGRPVIVIEPQPAFHLDVGFTWLDDRVVAVADPRLAASLVAERSVQPGDGITPSEMQTMLQVTGEKPLAEKYDIAAGALEAAGYQVVRLPNLAGLGLITPYLTYNNVLMENYLDEQGNTVRRVYMPVYGVPALDDAAREMYGLHGFQVTDMPSARYSTRLWGSVRCATGELHVTE